MSQFYDFVAPVLEAGITLALFGVLVFLVLGRFYKYWMILLYVMWELLATLGLTVADLAFRGSAVTAVNQGTAAQLLYARLYWTNDVIVDLFRFVLVLVLIYFASPDSRRVSRPLLAMLVVAALVLPFILFNPSFRVVAFGSVRLRYPSTGWFQSTSELLNFGAAIMNLMLWGTLLTSKRRDPQILLVSLGLGIVVTGTAMAYGIRHLINPVEFKPIGYLIMNLSQLLGWFVWCRAFWPVRKPRQVFDAPVSSV